MPRKDTAYEDDEYLPYYSLEAKQQDTKKSGSVVHLGIKEEQILAVGIAPTTPKEIASVRCGDLFSDRLCNYLRVAVIGVLVLVLLDGCRRGKRYVPVVKYSKPSQAALKKTLRGVYGDRYRYAGQGPHKFDCSGLTYYSYATMNLWLPRRAIDQSKVGRTVSLHELQIGDLIFFDTHKRRKSKVNHVGIYQGGGYFIHASSAKKRVIASRLNKPFYRSRIVVCKRLIKPKILPKPPKVVPVLPPQYSDENLF